MIEPELTNQQITTLAIAYEMADAQSLVGRYFTPDVGRWKGQRCQVRSAVNEGYGPVCLFSVCKPGHWYKKRISPTDLHRLIDATTWTGLGDSV